MDAKEVKVAIVTGASSGIGRMTARALCKAGWRVVLSARREAELNETANLCRQDYDATESAHSGGGLSSANDRRVPKNLTLVVTGDVTKEEDVKRLFETAIAEYGRVDVLFNNAGITGPTCPLENLQFADFEAVIRTNLVAAVLCTQHAIMCFKSQSPPGGRIINNGSLAAHVPRPHGAAYAISKHAILGLTKSTQLEGRQFGISCTQLDIGNAMTQMAHGAATSGALQPDGSTRVEGAIDAQHVANAVVHVANLPLDVTVLEMNIMATNMPYVGRG
ncbi:hypothetical protein FRC20_005095 [Serendipita sp. 405]|nr:hypothetical protein FRC15_005231 [Serendipita sp. 397]KAG8775274.1 hypothetical protein FRC16_004859 [Serendipita sp. 398]KAG8841329.1 hypothetical protein FRC20_005095 [Serendipita sp. 405]